jgi:OOP family OmpA-OmpF porin
VIYPGAVRIENDLAAAANTALKEGGFDWASVRMEGQTAVLSGTAPTERDRMSAHAVVLAAHGPGAPVSGGIVAVDDRLSVAPAAGPFAWRALGGDGRVTLSGSVPNEGVRTLLLTEARRAFPRGVTDEMAVAAGAPAGDWQGTALTALRALARLKRGEADVAGTLLNVRGEAADAAAAAAVTAEVRRVANGFSGTADVRSAAAANAGPVNQALPPVTAQAPEKTIAQPPAAGSPPATVAPADCQRQIRSLAQQAPIRFQANSAKPSPASQRQLDRIAEVARRCPGARIGIAGFTDSSGSELANRQLSFNRAQGVLAHLAAAGVPRERMTASGYGPLRPVASNDTAEGRARNRRIEFEIQP